MTDHGVAVRVSRLDVNRELTPKPRTEDHEFTAFARRIIRAHGRRVASADPTALADLVSVRASLDAAIQESVDGLRASGYSWAEIGREMGISRQAAQQRWGVA